MNVALLMFQGNISFVRRDNGGVMRSIQDARINIFRMENGSYIQIGRHFNSNSNFIWDHPLLYNGSRKKNSVYPSIFLKRSVRVTQVCYFTRVWLHYSRNMETDNIQLQQLLFLDSFGGCTIRRLVSALDGVWIYNLTVTF